jgi:hypothetical protein
MFCIFVIILGLIHYIKGGPRQDLNDLKFRRILCFGDLDMS